MEDTTEKKEKEVQLKFGSTGLDLRMKNYEAVELKSVCKSLSGGLVISLALMFIIMTLLGFLLRLLFHL